MDLVTSFSQFSEWIKAFKIDKKAVCTNCFMLPGEIEKHISSGRIAVVSSPEELFFFIAENGFRRLVYYTSNPLSSKDTESLLCASGIMPVLADLVARDSEPSQMDRIIETKWKPAGFSLYKTYIRLLMREIPSECFEPMEYAFQVNGRKYCIGTGDPLKAEEVVSLWGQCLDPFSITLPGEEETSSFIRQGKVHCITDDTGRLCAAMLRGDQGQRATVQHVCVHPDFRRLGLAHILMKASMHDAVKAGIHTCFLWVDEKNHPAIQLYKRFGFEPDGMISRQLLFDGKPLPAFE